MILGDPALAAVPGPPGQARVTLDAIFRRMAARRPDALALLDAPNRATFTDGAPRRLSFAEADRLISALALRLRQMGLAADAVVGIQMPNIVENVLAILAVLRAGMIAAPLPLLWRRADAAAALARSGGKALITVGRVGGFNHCQFAMRVAAEVFSIRYVCAFGRDLPDGVVALDDLFAAKKAEPPPALAPERADDAGAHLAVITFDVGPDGVVPVARNHLQLMAGGLGVVLESGIAQDATIVSTLAPSSFAGICLTLLPWLLSGGTLALHQPFEPRLLVAQLRDSDPCGAVVLPASIAFRLAETGTFGRGGPLSVIAPWRAPERLFTSPAWHGRLSGLVDVSVFGETGLIAARRSPNGRPPPLPLGPVTAPRGGTGAVRVAEVVPTRQSTVGLRGPMVPHHAFPPGVERTGLPHFAVGPGGVVDTGYACQVDPQAKTVMVSDAPEGIVCVGGYRFPLHDLQDAVARVDPRATLLAVPDTLVGARLIGNATDRYMLRAALDVAGINPIVVGAFAERADATVAARASAVR
jgi:hypothetical protein